MSDEHYSEILLIDLSRAQREAIALPVDTGETYDKDGKIVQMDDVDNRAGDCA